jgi:hypothetical protein
MSLSTKILVIIGSVLLLCLTAFIVYQQIENSQRNLAIETQVVKQKELLDNITRSMNEFATKANIEEFAQENNISLQIIQNDLDKLHAEIKSINVVTINSNGYTGDNLPGNTGVKNPNPPNTPTVDCNGKPLPCPNLDTYGYLLNRNNLQLSEKFDNTTVPIGSVGFSAWQQNPWNINILSRQYKLTTVVGMDENQRQYFYNKFTVNVDNKDYDVKIATATTKQEYPEAKFNFWNPRLFFGADFGMNTNKMTGEFTPSFNIGIMSYGQFKIQPDFSIIELGVGYGVVDRKPQIILTPVMYNVAKHLPLVNNMYFGPSFHLGTNGEFSIMGGLRVGL